MGLYKQQICITGHLAQVLRYIGWAWFTNSVGGKLRSDWQVDKKFIYPCRDVTFDPLQGGKWTGGAVSRTLPILPIKVVNGKLVVSDVFVGYVGVKRG